MSGVSAGLMWPGVWGVTNAALQHVEEGTVRMTASQLWQICGVAGIEIADIFAGLPTHLYKTDTDYEQIQDLKRHALANPNGQETLSQENRFPGLSEPSGELGPAAAFRADLAALVMAARNLTREEIAFLTKAGKGIGRIGGFLIVRSKYRHSER